MDKGIKRMLSIALALVLVLSCLPAGALSVRAEAEQTLAGKTISILGDSISTFEGVSNDASVNATLKGGAIYYNEGTLGISRQDTWWQQTVDALGLRLLVNNAWSGSCVLHTRAGTVGGYVGRSQQLHNDKTGEEPDIIAVFLGTNDFSYYQSALGNADIDYESLIQENPDGTFTYANPATTCEAYAIMLHKMILRYPDAEVYCMTMLPRRNPVNSGADVGQPTGFNGELTKIITRFGCNVVDLENCGITSEPSNFDGYMTDKRVHPGPKGMDMMTKALVQAILGEERILHSVEFRLNEVVADKITGVAAQGASLKTALTPAAGCDGLKVSVTMGGTDITDTCYKDGVLEIGAVTGDVVITASAYRPPESYRWEFNGSDLISVESELFAENKLTKQAGSTADGVFSDTRYALGSKVVLLHDLPWVLEWKGSGDGGFMLSEAADAAGAPFFFRRAGNYLNAFGDHDGSRFNNYGLALSTTDIDGSALHTYRLKNYIAADGTNMVYLYVDGVEIGALNNYYVGGSAQGTTDDWISGKDFKINYIGTPSHPLTNYALEYLMINEGGHSYTTTVTAPTCTTGGYTTHTCTTCGACYTSDHTDAMGHSFNQWIQVKAPACDAEGQDRRTCTVCGESQFRDTRISGDPNKILVSNPVEDGFFEGKEIVLIGDSITYGVGVDDRSTETYGVLLANMLNATAVNKGVSGSGYCSGGKMTTNSTLTQSNIQNADVITIMLGINDWNWAVKDGYWNGKPGYYEESETYYQLGEFDSTDTSTFYGALHEWCQTITAMKQIEGFEEKQFVVITPLITSWNVSKGERNWNQDKQNVHGHTLRQYCTAIMEVCAYYNIPVFDANMYSGIYYNSAEDNNVDVTGGDGVHVNAKGHMLLAEALAEFLLEGYTYENRAVADCGHSFEETVTEPTCTEDGYTYYRCPQCCFSYTDNETEATGHTYQNVTCTGCGAVHPNVANYEGKVISILGDSISTFAGYIPTADGFNLEHYARYPQDNLLTDVNETWWMQVLTELDAKLGINESWRSTEVYNYIDAEVNSSYDGTKACMASLTRIQNLGSNGAPDVILFFGGTNDITQSRPVGTFDPAAAPTEVVLTSVKWDSVADAYVDAIMRMQYYYPDAQIIAMLPFDRNSQGTDKVERYNSLFISICEHYGVPYVDLRACGISDADLPDGTHPDATGMDYITNAVLDILLNESEMEAGEHIVHSVTHKLTGAESSLSYYKGISHGNSFETTITGENLEVTVTMGGVDVTDDCYASGVVTIETVTGDLIITATGLEKTIYADYLQELPEHLCSGTNLWAALTPINLYYTGSGWGLNASGSIYSVTIPVAAGDQIWATSFQKSGTNGGTRNGIRLTWFDENGVLESVSPDNVYAEFAADGYLTAPEGAVAVNVVMWDGNESSEVYILNRDHTYENGICMGCGAHLPGDINGDGKVNNKDATRLFQHLSGWAVEVVEAALDVNGDGKVNNKDATRLFQYLSGWSVEIH